MFSFKSFIVVGGGALFIWGRCLSLLGFHSCNLVPAINTDKLATAPPPLFFAEELLVSQTQKPIVNNDVLVFEFKWH